MTYKSKIALDKFLEIIKNTDETFLDPDKVIDIAKERVEQMGIIFIDEIDKIAVSSGKGNDVSR